MKLSLGNLRRVVALAAYYGFATYLPGSYTPVVGRACNAVRIFCVRGIFRRCGKVSTIDRRAYFGTGRDIEIGDYSGIGAYCQLPHDLKIGDYVMMGPRVVIHTPNHRISDPHTPMALQGYEPRRECRICDDVWIGSDAIINHGKTISRGMVVASGAVVTKDFPEYSVVGGNPAVIIKSRLNDD